MRRIVLIGLLGTLAGCATQTPPPHGPGRMASGRPHGSGGGGDRERRPEQGRGQLFVSPMGEPFRASQRPGAAQEQWFAGTDADVDGRITEAEFQRDATRFFAVLDRGKDGEIDPDDLAYYENTMVPEIRVAGNRGPAGSARGPRGGGGRSGGRSAGGRSGQGRGGGSGGDRDAQTASADKTSGAAVRERRGAARYGFFDLPEPVAAADRNLNRGIDAREFAYAAATRYSALDTNHDGTLTRGELPRAGAETWRNGSDRPPPPPVTAEPSSLPSQTP